MYRDLVASSISMTVFGERKDIGRGSMNDERRAFAVTLARQDLFLSRIFAVGQMVRLLDAN